MKKLHRRGAVHPTPPVVSDHLLSLLPTAILILTTALSPEEKEVLAYLISCSSNNNLCPKTPKKITDHAPCFNCNCFRCYMSYWVKWDSSPNRHLIHQIIDGFEENLPKDCNKSQKTKKERSRGHKGNNKKVFKEKDSILGVDESSTSSSSTSVEMSMSMTQVEESSSVVGDEEVEIEEEEEMVVKGGSVRRFMGFLGGKIWSVWG